MSLTEHIYLCIFRANDGEKIAEKVTVRVPTVGEIIAISYLDAQGDFEVIREIQRIPTKEYEMVSLEVKAVDRNPPRKGLKTGRKSIYVFFQAE